MDVSISVPNLRLYPAGRRGRGSTSFLGYLDLPRCRITRSVMIRAFGEPHLGPADSGDGKVTTEWVFGVGSPVSPLVLTIYDYKGDGRWHVGSSEPLRDNPAMWIRELYQRVIEVWLVDSY